MSRAFFVVLLGSLLLPCAAPAVAQADPPKILEFRTQVVKQKTYFHLRLEAPADLANPALRRNPHFDFWDPQATPPALPARLVPQNGNARLVYGGDLPGTSRMFVWGEGDGGFGAGGAPAKPAPAGKNVLEFYGVLTGKQPAELLLLYPKAPDIAQNVKDKKTLSLLELIQQKNSWGEETIKLDPARAKKVPLPDKARDNRQTPPPLGDLEGRWAVAQAEHFARLEGQTPEFGFFSFARETTRQLYKIPFPRQLGGGNNDPFAASSVGRGTQRLYELTTGAAAIAESLALERMRSRGQPANKAAPRTIAIGEVQGIDVAEHPWQRMMGDKVPAREPLARLVPSDNYYVHFKTIGKFLEAADLLDQWGTPVVRACEVNSRDYRIRQKLEQQLCLKSTGLARILGPAVIHGLVVTGNDPYLREGSDFSMIFDLVNKKLFLAGAELTLNEARKKFSKTLREDKMTYQGVTIESFVTPLREVSLHRAVFGDYAVYSNSAVAVQRIIDTNQGKIRPLAEALDFQYLRTIFRHDDPDEDGFIYLSDAFIRNLVGPAVRIKERRRLEALTSMHMLTDAAMYTAWETGKPAQNQQQILAVTGLEQEELVAGDGNFASWDSERKVAFSSLYNTLAFATPLIEIPIDKTTPAEAQEYQTFRQQYLGLWRRYFDPIGIRLSLKKEQARLDVYILPLVATSQYNQLRRITGQGSIKIDPAMFSNKTLLQYLMHVSPQVFGRDVLPVLGNDLVADLALRSWLGDWFTVRFDDSDVYAKLLQSYIRAQMFPEQQRDFTRDLDLLFQVPVTVGFQVRSTVVFAGLLTKVRSAIENTLPGAIEWEPLKEPYKDVPIVRIKVKAEKLIGAPDRWKDLNLYYALIDSAFYVSLQEAPIREIIDHSIAMKDNKKGPPTIEVNTMLHLSPRAAVQAKDLLKLYLEWEAHRRAQINNRLLYALYKSNVVGPQDDSATVEAAALQYLGFVPVSPDLAPFRYEWKKDEVVNRRHGSERQPTLNPGVDAASPLGQILEEFATIRADLRFREDGIHTTVTLQRNVAK